MIVLLKIWYIAIIQICSKDNRVRYTYDPVIILKWKSRGLGVILSQFAPTYASDLGYTFKDDSWL